MITPRLLFKGDPQAAIKYVGLAKKLARQTFEAGILNKVFRVAAGVTITVNNAIKANICKVWIEAKTGIIQGFVGFPTSADASNGWYVNDDGERIANPYYHYLTQINPNMPKTYMSILHDGSHCASINRDQGILYGNQKAYLWTLVAGKWKPGKSVWSWWHSSRGDFFCNDLNIENSAPRWMTGFYRWSYTGDWFSDIRYYARDGAENHPVVPNYVYKNGRVIWENAPSTILGLSQIDENIIIYVYYIWPGTLCISLWNTATSTGNFLGNIYVSEIVEGYGRLAYYDQLKRSVFRFNASNTEVCGIVYDAQPGDYAPPSYGGPACLDIYKVTCTIIHDEDDNISLGPISVIRYDTISKTRETEEHVTRNTDWEEFLPYDGYGLYDTVGEGTADYTYSENTTYSGRIPLAVNYIGNDQIIAWIDYNECVSSIEITESVYRRKQWAGWDNVGHDLVTSVHAPVACRRWRMAGARSMYKKDVSTLPRLIIEYNGSEEVIIDNITSTIEFDRTGTTLNSSSRESYNIWNILYMDLQSGIVVYDYGKGVNPFKYTGSGSGEINEDGSSLGTNSSFYGHNIGSVGVDFTYEDLYEQVSKGSSIDVDYYFNGLGFYGVGFERDPDNWRNEGWPESWPSDPDPPWNFEPGIWDVEDSTTEDIVYGTNINDIHNLISNVSNIEYGIMADFRGASLDNPAYVYSFRIRERAPYVSEYYVQGSNLTDFNSKFNNADIEGDYVSIHPIGLF